MREFVRSGFVVLALCAFSLVGCESKRLWLSVTGLDGGYTEGVWLWRLSELSGTYERTCRFPFFGTDDASGVERLEFTQECEDSHVGRNYTVPVQRSASRPDVITVGLLYLQPLDQGVYKISSYGSYGETALSNSILEL